MAEIPLQPSPEPKKRLGFAELRQAFQNVGLKITKRAIQSANFVAGSLGWRLTAEGDLEASSGTFRGSIVGSSINIPNATTPLFSVDAAGNVVARSLRRSDFHWFTFFESIDGYQQVTIGTGSYSVSRDGVTLASGATQFSEAQLVKGYSGGANTSFLWTKKRSVKFQFSVSAITNQNVYIATGSIDGVTDNHFGIYIENAAIYGTCANGTTQTTTTLSTNAVAGTRYTFEVVFTPGVDVKYYLDGVLKGTATTNLPSGSDFPFVLFDGKIICTAAADKQMIINYFDIWQEN